MYASDHQLFNYFDKEIYKMRYDNVLEVDRVANNGAQIVKYRRTFYDDNNQVRCTLWQTKIYVRDMHYQNDPERVEVVYLLPDGGPNSPLPLPRYIRRTSRFFLGHESDRIVEDFYVLENKGHLHVLEDPDRAEQYAEQLRQERERREEEERRREAIRRERNRHQYSLFESKIHSLSESVDMLHTYINAIYDHFNRAYDISEKPNVEFDESDNYKNALGQTANYNPETKTITLFTKGRHIKDILRSYAHELYHHIQYLYGKFDDVSGNIDENYAQNNKKLRELEKEAYMQGNINFRDWEDQFKMKNKLSEKVEKFAKKIAHTMIKENRNVLSKKETKSILALISLNKPNKRKEFYDSFISAVKKSYGALKEQKILKESKRIKNMIGNKKEIAKFIKEIQLKEFVGSKPIEDKEGKYEDMLNDTRRKVSQKSMSLDEEEDIANDFDDDDNYDKCQAICDELTELVRDHEEWAEQVVEVLEKHGYKNIINPDVFDDGRIVAEVDDGKFVWDEQTEKVSFIPDDTDAEYVEVEAEVEYHTQDEDGWQDKWNKMMEKSTPSYKSSALNHVDQLARSHNAKNRLYN